MMQGLWVITGLLAFLLLEKMFPDQDSQEDTTSESDLNFNCAVSTWVSVCQFLVCCCIIFIYCALQLTVTCGLQSCLLYEVTLLSIVCVLRLLLFNIVLHVLLFYACKWPAGSSPATAV